MESFDSETLQLIQNVEAKTEERTPRQTVDEYYASVVEGMALDEKVDSMIEEAAERFKAKRKNVDY